MDGYMAGDMEGDMDGDDDERSEAPSEKVFDVTKCPRCMWMVEQQINDLPNFDPTEPRTMMTPVRYELLFKFLENPEYSKLFVWVDTEAPYELVFSYD